MRTVGHGGVCKRKSVPLLVCSSRCRSRDTRRSLAREHAKRAPPGRRPLARWVRQSGPAPPSARSQANDDVPGHCGETASPRSPAAPCCGPHDAPGRTSSPACEPECTAPQPGPAAQRAFVAAAAGSSPLARGERRSVESPPALARGRGGRRPPRGRRSPWARLPSERAALLAPRSGRLNTVTGLLAVRARMRAIARE